MTDNLDPPESSTVDVVIIGAGFAGLYLVHKLRSLGYSVLGIEAGNDVGGTWFWNRYPGARCDVESMQYSYSFSEELQQEWRWTERFATQQEILSYLHHVADRFDLRRGFVFNSRVVSARFRETDSRWIVETNTKRRWSARFCILATGCLSIARNPAFEGLENYTGKILHTAQWPSGGVDFTGQSVGILGTGSSAVQAIPPIAAQAKHLYVFQRTPNFSVPARNAPITSDYENTWKDDYSRRRELARQTRSGVMYDYGTTSALAATPTDRELEYARRWKLGGTNFLYAYNDTLRSEEANKYCADFVRGRIAETVKDPAVAERLTPRDYPIGAKRICVDTDYYETFNRDNVTLIDVREHPIQRFTASGIQTSQAEHPLDAMIFATGFDAMTGAVLNIDITGRDGLRMSDKWRDGPKSYLGLAISGFPNLFTITGPGSPSVLSNVVMAIEQHVNWIADCICDLDRLGASTIEAEERAETEWDTHVENVARQTLYYSANSWFLGANVPGKPRVFMPYVGGFNVYSQTCKSIAEASYKGFKTSR